MTLPRIGISLGDPGGIGPEVVIKALSRSLDLPEAVYVLFGTRSVLERNGLKDDLSLVPFSTSALMEKPLAASRFLYEIPQPEVPFVLGESDRHNGEISFRYFEAAVAQARAGVLSAVVTAPISKHSWKLAGIPYAGHTEYLAQTYPRAVMTFWSSRLKVALFTHHLSLQNALKRITRENLSGFLLSLHEDIKQATDQKYRYWIAGLNPHAGENGMLGDEEISIIIPAVEDARRSGMQIEGPFPPDVIFRKALDLSDVIVIALYHDQGLIAFKTVVFEEGVNVTLGLPFVRTSPDHGTAFDIAGRGTAESESMIAALRLAAELSGSS